jgi:hypothetical protein
MGIFVLVRLSHVEQVKVLSLLKAPLHVRGGRVVALSVSVSIQPIE